MTKRPGIVKTTLSWIRIIASISGVVTLAALPYVGMRLQNVPHIWPPLGSFEKFGAPIASLIIGAFGLIPTILIKTSAIKRSLWMVISVVILVAIVSVSTYAYFLLAYVKGVDTPNDGIQYRTVGTQRTPLAQQLFPQESDEQILKRAGLTDADIEAMWTPSSVLNARFRLFFSYLFGSMSINFVMGSLAYLHRVGTSRRSRGKSPE